MKKTLSRSKTFDSDLTKLDKRLQRQATLPLFHHANEFDYKRDAKLLAKAVKQCITAQTLDLSFLLNYFSAHNGEQRMLVVQALEYDHKYKLIDMIVEQPDSPLRSAMLAVIVEPVELYVRDFHDLLLLKQTGQISRDISRSLLEILLGLNNDETKKLTETYLLLFDNPIEKDVELVQGEQKIIAQLLAELLKGQRYEEPNSSAAIAKTIAKKLYEAGEGTPGLDYDTFIRIFCRDAFSQLSTIFDIYEDLYKKPIQAAIEQEFAGAIERECFQDMVEFVRSPGAYFSRVLRQAFDSAPIDYSTLMRIIVGHAERDLGEIELEYSKIFDQTLDRTIEQRIPIAEIKSLFLFALRKREHHSPYDDELVRFSHANNSSAAHQQAPAAAAAAAATTHGNGLTRNRSHEAFDKFVNVFKTMRPH